MNEQIRQTTDRLVEYSDTARDVRRVLEQAIGWIGDAQAALGALDGSEAAEARALAAQVRDDLSNVAYGWLNDVDQTSLRLRHLLLD